MTLRKKITLILSISSLTLILIFFIVINTIVNISFNKYIKVNQEKRENNIVNYISQMYSSNDEFNDDIIYNIMHQAMMENQYISIFDENENTIWAMNHDQHGMMGGSTGKYIENTYVINSENKPNIYVKIGQFTSTLLSKEDITFKNTLNVGLLVTSIFGIFLAIILGTVLAKQFSRPIIKLKETTDVIKSGNFDVNIDFHSNTKEIDELKESINHLSNTLKEQEYLRERLTSDISHELRTPLHILLNQFEVLIDGIWEPTKERLEICRDEIYRLTNIVNELDNLKRLEHNHHFELRKVKYSLNEILLQVINQFEPSFHSKGINFEYLNDEVVYAQIDKDKIIQVLYNLLSNAYKFSKPNGYIQINLSKDNNNAIITISDAGIGIRKEDIKHIFDRFYRVEQSRSRKTGGSGLGLSIVKGIINAHGGNIIVQSELNVGTKFIITIPIGNVNDI